MSPGQLDATVVRRHLLALERARRNLEAHSGVTIEQLEADMDMRWLVERGLQLCAQNALDIATHLAAKAGLDSPDYAGAIDALAEAGVLPRPFAKRFRGVAGFRNILVHGYLEVDLSIVHGLLTGALRDFVIFATHIEAALDRAPDT